MENIFHKAIKDGLVKEGWQITEQPFAILRDLGKYEDPGVAETLAAQRGSRQIAVTIHSFIGPSLLHDFFLALGRFMHYRFALEHQGSDRTLYLAVPLDAYEEFFERKHGQFMIREEGLKLLVFSVEKGEIVKWIS